MPQARPLFLATALTCVTVGALGGTLIASLTRAADPRPARFVPARQPPPALRLRDERGRWRTLADARGHVVALTFLYTGCRDLCPYEAAEIRDAVGEVGGGVEVYGISVDPVGDTPAHVRSFLRRLGLQGKMHYLIGSRRQLQPVWESFGVVPISATPAEAARAAAVQARLMHPERWSPQALAERQRELASRPPPRSADDAFPDVADERYRGRPRHIEGADFEHTAYVMLLDRRGRQRVGFPVEHVEEDVLVRDMRLLLAER